MCVFLGSFVVGTTNLSRLCSRQAGGTASGKTTVCDHIMQRLHDQCVVMLCQDSFYRGLTPEELKDVSSAVPALFLLADGEALDGLFEVAKLYRTHIFTGFECRLGISKCCVLVLTGGQLI
jgi:hypothetical protein